MSTSTLRLSLAWLATLLVPIVLVLASVRILMTSAFLKFEYNLPGFPPDPYGFSKAERLYWSQIALDYLLNPEGISFLGDLRFQDGSPVYNDRELGHMVDVKNVARGALRVWYAALASLAVLGVWARWGGWWTDYLTGLQRGGRLTIGLMGVIIVVVLVGFGFFFVGFHQVFFQPGTWMFLFSDTLIRLFPERFWQVAFISIGVLSLAMALGMAFLIRRPVP